tara:strand:- start:129 stop:281 length:153 start_codon:yes stop_codon:yes gene_type:complete
MNMRWEKQITDWLHKYIDDVTDLEFNDEVVSLRVNDKIVAILVLQQLRGE